MNLEITEVKNDELEKDLDEILKLNMTAFENMINKDWYSIDSFVKELIYEMIDDKGTIVKAYDKDTNEIAGFLTIARYPDKCLIDEVNLSSEYTSYIEMENCVVKENYRGNNLQYQMFKYGEEIMKNRFKKIKGAYVTVHPNNLASYNNITKAGYEVVKQTKMYNDYDRYILLKKFN